jgi:hypothetical protein
MNLVGEILDQSQGVRTMFTLSAEVWRRSGRPSRRPEVARRPYHVRPNLEALEDRNLLAASPTNPAAAATTALVGSASSGPTTNTQATQTTTTVPAANNGTLLTSVGSPTTNGTVTTPGQSSLNLGSQFLNDLTPTGSTPPLGQIQSALTGSSLPLTFPVNSLLPGGQPSPGVPFGFAGRIVFANTGTPERTGQGSGEFSPAAGVVPTGLYLGSGGGDLEAATTQPRRPNPVPMPGLPGRGVGLLETDPDGGLAADVLPAATIADLALEGYAGVL